MCEYCTFPNTKPVMNGDARVTVAADESEMWVEWYGECDGCADHERINFCPMCGRDLRGDAS